MKIPYENMSWAAHRHHMTIICFISILRPYILAFLLVLTMECQHLMKWVCSFKCIAPSLLPSHTPSLSLSFLLFLKGHTVFIGVSLYLILCLPLSLSLPPFPLSLSLLSLPPSLSCAHSPSLLLSLTLFLSVLPFLPLSLFNSLFLSLTFSLFFQGKYSLYRANFVLIKKLIVNQTT